MREVLNTGIYVVAAAIVMGQGGYMIFKGMAVQAFNGGTYPLVQNFAALHQQGVVSHILG